MAVLNRIPLRWFPDLTTKEKLQSRVDGFPVSAAPSALTWGSTAPADKPSPTIVHCYVRNCRFSASAINEGRAIRAIAAHCVAKHLPKKQES